MSSSLFLTISGDTATDTAADRVCFNGHYSRCFQVSNSGFHSHHVTIRRKERCSMFISASASAASVALSFNKPQFRHHRRFSCNSQLGDIAPATSAAYGLLLLGGGLFAYSKSGSKGSLFGGITGAALMGTVYFLMREPDTIATADALGFGTAFLFTSIFGIRLAATKKLTPAGPLLAVSLLALVVFFSAYLQNSP